MSHPVIGKRYLFPIFIISFLLLLSSSAFATVIISGITVQSNQAFQGTTGNNVLKINLVVGAGDSIDQITIDNDSSDIPFGSSSIERIAIYNNSTFIPANNRGEAFPPDGSPQAYQVPVTGIAPGAHTLYVIYDVDSRANASEVGGTERHAGVELGSVRGTLSGETVPTINVVNNVKILPSGLSYDQSFVQSMVPVTSVGAGFTDVPMMKLRLRANNQVITVNSITIMSGDGISLPGNFAPNTFNAEQYVKKIQIYEDTNNNSFFDGFGSVDTLVGTRNLGNGNSPWKAAVTINGSTYIEYNNVDTDKNTRMFFVFYDMGNGMANDTQVYADLGDAAGDGFLSGALQLNGVLPASANIFLTIVSVNAYIVSASVNLPSYAPAAFYGIAGERQIPMIAFTLNNNFDYSGAKVVISNAGGTFLSTGEGVSKVTLYRDIAGTLYLVGATSTFLNNNTAEIENVFLPAGSNIDYYVYYDMNVGASTGSGIQCQLETIEGNGLFFGGSLPAPQPAASFQVSPAPLVVLSVSENVNSVSAGQSFPLEITVRNIDNSNHMIIHSLRPAFYFQAIGGTDISSEYSYQVVSSSHWAPGPTITNYTPPSYVVTANNIVTYNVIVSAANLRTRGPVLVDGFVDYGVNTLIFAKPGGQSIYMSRYRSGGTYVPAALNNHYGSFVAFSGSSTPEFSYSLPDYIASMNVVPYGTFPEEPFLNGDMVAINSKLIIYFINNGDILDMSSLMVRKDGVLLSKGSDYLVDESNGIVTIQDMGGQSGTITIDGYSGDTAIETASIRYSIETGFAVKDVMAGPSPYKPSEGSMYFSFQLSEAASAKVYVYDSAGKLVYLSEEANFSIGYNEIAWDGTMDIGGIVGRGVYLVRIVAKSLDDDTEKVVKTKFAVF
ncbi:FlgD immunoglobulin-like domain containing protein [Candidatus Margulisiibacteriota bacterium]